MGLVQDQTSAAKSDDTGTSAVKRGGFRPDIEGLRGIAILLVVGFHARLGHLGGGYIGVDVFFVLSGYLITGLLIDELDRTARVDFAAFYARRVRRLLPAACLVTVSTLAVAAGFLSPLELTGLAHSALATVAYYSNFWFAHAATNYFAPSAQLNPFLHTWSLGVEEQFYLGFPLFTAAAALLGRRLGHVRTTLAVVLSTATLSSLALCVHLTTHQPAWAFFASPARAWEFAAGGVAVLIPRAALKRRAATVAATAGLVVVVVCGVAFTGTTSFPTLAAVVPVAGTIAVLVGGAGTPSGGALRLLTTRPLLYVGRISYSWYLWHWPVLVLAADVAGPLSLFDRVLSAGVSFALSTLTLVVVERPVRFSPWLIQRRWVSICVGAALVATGLVVVGLVRTEADRGSASAAQARLAALMAERALIYRTGCDSTFLSTALPRPSCVFGDTAAPKTVVLFGDSHAGQWFPAMDEAARREAWRLVPYVKDSCPTAVLSLFNVRIGRIYHECAEWRATAVAAIVQLHPAAVVIANDTLDYVGTGATVGLGQLSLAAWTRGLSDSVRGFTSRRIPAVVLADTPHPGFDVPACLSRLVAGTLFHKSCTFSRTDGLKPEVAAAEVATAQAQGAEIVTLNDLICAGDPCAVEGDGVVFFHDNSHLSTAFSLKLGPALASRLAAAGIP